jgi:lysozyme
MNKLSENFTELMVKFEGEKLVGYRDSAGLPTIGIGHLILPQDSYKVGKSITKEESRRLFEIDSKWAIVAVNSLVKVPLTQNQVDALTSIIFNIGGRAFAGSSLLRKLNQKNYERAAAHFLDWVKARSPKTGKLVTLKGLVTRRTAEKALFEKK